MSAFGTDAGISAQQMTGLMDLLGVAQHEAGLLETTACGFSEAVVVQHRPTHVDQSAVETRTLLWCFAFKAPWVPANFPYLLAFPNRRLTLGGSLGPC